MTPEEERRARERAADWMGDRFNLPRRHNTTQPDFNDHHDQEDDECPGSNHPAPPPPPREGPPR